MGRIRLLIVSLLVLVLGILLRSGFGQPAAKTLTINGYVLDSACAFTKNLSKPVSRTCAIACARAGSPLVVLSDDGTLYWPIASTMPATGQNAHLMRFAGKRVTVRGTVYEKGGSRAIVIRKIELK